MKRRYSSSQKNRLLKAWRDSGKPCSLFAKERGINESTFFNWIRKAKEVASKKTALLPLITEPSPSFLQLVPKAELPPLSLPSSEAPILTLHCLSGRTLRVPADIDPQSLARILRVLEA